MIIGVPKEIKDNEYRVGLVPAGVRALRDAGCRVIVETGAGAGSSIPDSEYAEAGAEIRSAEDAYMADLVVKVKEPRPEEYRFFREGQVIFTFFHLAANTALADELINKGVTAIAYETVELDDRTLPILAPMSEIAGRLSVQVGAHYLLSAYGGRGTLLSGVPGVERGKVAILGGGLVGINASRVAIGLGADTMLLDTRIERLRYLEDISGGGVRTLFSNACNIEFALKNADILIGAVHIPGARTPKLVTTGMLKMMKKGSVIVDVSVDQGGCIESIRPTTHSDPIYEVDGIIHYGVANMPGAVPRTATFALTNATLPYVMSIARHGFRAAAESDQAIKRGLNINNGRVVHPGVAEALGRKYVPIG
ncbi:MAG: alanine dehydrogenase [Deltaproteobacteria bacterium]|nr:alanine dehydrogenase [Deltaproteobacteria bacterium]